MSDAAVFAGPAPPRPELYPERETPRQNAADRWLRRAEGWIVPLAAGRRSRRLAAIVPAVHAAAAGLGSLDDAALAAEARAVSRRLRRAGATLPLADSARGFALVREASGRVLGMRHHDVQLRGAWAMASGMIAEMNTGEGKTLTATLAAILHGLAGRPVHVVTVNDYLARRDAEKLSPLYSFFGLTVGVVTEGMARADRRAAYACDITYCTNKELAFDHLKDRLVLAGMGGNLRRKLALAARAQDTEGGLLMRGLHVALIDEADSVLIDEARTPLILSGEADARAEAVLLGQALGLARSLVAGRDFRTVPDEARVELLVDGQRALEHEAARLGGPWLNGVQREDLVAKALSALHVMAAGEHYILKDGKVAIVDEYTGRVMADRFWSDGLHQLVEMKEGLPPSPRRLTLARMTYQRFFRRYRVLCGMSGTVSEVAGELWEVYRLKIARIPTHRPSRRRTVPDVVFASAGARWAGVASVAARLSARGAPVLIGTRSVAASLEASRYLAAAGVAHRVLNAADEEAEAGIVAAAGERGSVTVATNMAGRGTDIVLGRGVEEAGGLHVIMTERHDAGRIDRQLAGRAARQGDPGVFLAMLSLDDALLAEAPAGWQRSLARLALARRWPWLARLAMRRAQLAAEARHARVRRDLLANDDGLDHALAFSGTPE
jgi:preprotein translocase subunit SecA